MAPVTVTARRGRWAWARSAGSIPPVASSGADLDAASRARGEHRSDSRNVRVTPSKLLRSPDFHRLVRRRWRTSLLLTAALFVLYYGYILLVATNKTLLARRVGETTTLGIVLGAAVIVGAWALTAIYVVWANRRYDPEVARLRRRLEG